MCHDCRTSEFKFVDLRARGLTINLGASPAVHLQALIGVLSVKIHSTNHSHQVSKRASEARPAVDCLTAGLLIGVLLKPINTFLHYTTLISPIANTPATRAVNPSLSQIKSASNRSSSLPRAPSPTVARQRRSKPTQWPQIRTVRVPGEL